MKSLRHITRTPKCSFRKILTPGSWALQIKQEVILEEREGEKQEPSKRKKTYFEYHTETIEVGILEIQNEKKQQNPLISYIMNNRNIKIEFYIIL